MVLTGLASELLLYVAGRRDHLEVLVAAPWTVPALELNRPQVQRTG